MSHPLPLFPGTTTSFDRDKLHLSAYYDDAGRITNIDVGLNVENISLDNIAAIIEMLTKAAKREVGMTTLPFPPNVNVTTTNGRG